MKVSYIAIASFSDRKERDEWVGKLNQSLEANSHNVDYLEMSAHIRTGHVTFYPWYSLKRLFHGIFHHSIIFSKSDA